jgi:hypothetical protein
VKDNCHSSLDQRLVRENFLRRAQPAAWALYLALVTVADAQGLSYYSDATLSRLLQLEPLGLAQARQWLDQVANVRVHGESHQVPQALFGQERTQLRPLTVLPYDLATLHPVLASRRRRVTFDTNRYSVPPACAGQSLTLKVTPGRLYLYHRDQLIAEHVRSYERHQDYERAEHVAELLAQRRQARAQQLLPRFLALSPKAAEYYRGLEENAAIPATTSRRSWP